MIETDASKEEAYVLRGYSRLLQGKPSEAASDLTRAHTAFTYKMLGDGFLAVRDGKRAMHFYQQAQKLQANFPELAAAMKVAKDIPSPAQRSSDSQNTPPASPGTPF